MRRCGLATAGAAIPAMVTLAALLLALAAAPAVPTRAAAWEPDDGREGVSGVGRVLELPGRLLRRSREGFEKMMRLLALRSVTLMPNPKPPGPDRPKRDWPAAPDNGDRDWGDVAPWSPEPPRERTNRRRPMAEVDDAPPRRRVRRDWHKSWSHSCRRAGRRVEGAGWYVVAPGDTLQRIAWLHYGDEGAWRRILHVNGVSDPDMIYACQRLFIPRRHADGPPDRRPNRRPDRPWCEEPPTDPVPGACNRPPPRPPHRGPGGCSRCGAGAHAEAWDRR